MISDRGTQKAIQQGLRSRFPGHTDPRGYVRAPAENLIDGVHLEQFEEDLRSGDGDELHGKFCAVHSSTALAVNTFAWFKTNNRLALLALLSAKGARSVSFERKLPIFRGGRPPNLDVWIEADDMVIVIEAKLSEYLVKKRPQFSPAYERLAPPCLAEPCWWQVYEQSKVAGPGYLDVAQLVKHYFGLRKFQRTSGQKWRLIFLYLFWEPLGWQRIPACRQHRQELEQLARAVLPSAISFKAMTYYQLWEMWANIPELAQHAQNLKERYEVNCVTPPDLIESR